MRERSETLASVFFSAPTTPNPFLEVGNCRRYTSSLSTKHSRRSHARLSKPHCNSEGNIRVDDLSYDPLVRLGVEIGASKTRNKPRALLRLRLSPSNPISVRGLSHYRRGVSRCHSHSQRNTALLSRRASRLRTRLQ